VAIGFPRRGGRACDGAGVALWIVTVDPRTPVIVGAGQVLRRDVPGGESCEPVGLIVEALRRAGEDSATAERLLRRADSVRCVPVIAWPYADLAALVAEGLGAKPRETVQSSAVGGDGPQRLLNDTCAQIAVGQLDVALLGRSLVRVQAGPF
jgi:acetyl-CoA C-acetyltransferase